MVDLFADDGLSDGLEAELVDECLYSALLLRGGQRLQQSKLHEEHHGLFHGEHGVQEVVLHDISRYHLEELPIELLIVESDRTLQALPHDVVHKGIDQGGLVGATCP